MSVVSTADTRIASPRLNEDWLAAILGLVIFAAALVGLSGTDLAGWVVSTSVWTDPTVALAPFAKAWAGLGGPGAAAATFVAFLIVLSFVAWVAGRDIARFVPAVAVVLVIAYASWFVGSWANFAAVTPADLSKFGLSWSLKLTNEGGFIVALIVGLIISNIFPKFADWLKEAILPELYVKIAIVLIGGFVAVTAAGQLSLASSILLRGVAAIIEAYLIYWAVVYWVARNWFGFKREWAVPLASGISICGVAAAISTGGAIRARPQVAVLVSSLVVVFAVIELLIIPWLAQTFLWNEPLVAAAWVGLAVKTDGAAVAAGGITEALINAKNAAVGIKYDPNWILGTTATVKVFIDIFIGVWAFLLAWIWTNHVEPKADGSRATAGEIWQRFPKFIIGFVITFVVGLALALSPEVGVAKLKPFISEANTFRVIFFILTFFSIGVASNFRVLWREGLAKLVAVYVVSLFGFVIWVGLLISWLFFAGVKPPLAG
ncbi:MAG: putative sulfate exporter family transporter [Ancalomicrobiaceae bacterium]|nr:putative sulfate exporter family transporter [Ancalomicrobiaceae bacterium]